MKTNGDVIEQNKVISDDIAQCFARCKSFPGPSKERYEELNAFAERLGALTKRQAAIESAATLAETDKLSAHNDERREIAKELGRIAADEKALKAKIEDKATQTNANTYAAVMDEFRSTVLRAQQLRERQTAMIDELHALNFTGITARNKWLEKGADEEILSVQTEMKELLTEAGLYERGLMAKVGDVVDARAALLFEKQGDLYAEASRFHNTNALAMLFLMAAIIGLSAWIIIILFDVNAIHERGSSISAMDTGSIAERIFTMGAGRIAILILIAWSLRFVGGLHRSHSQQAVLYRDRRAALDVAASLIKVAPSVEQKQQLLQNMANGYLDFEQSAFRHERPLVSGSSAPSLEALRDTVSALKPVFDGFKDVVSKAK